MATNPVLLINSITSCLASVSSPDVKMTVRGLFGREVLYPGHRHVADRFNKPCANRHLSDYLAGCAPLQCGARSGHASQTNVWGLQMCVRRIDQDAASPINTLESVSYTDPMRGKNDDVALGSLLLRPGDGAWTEISDKISQCLRTSGIGYNYGVTSGYQMTAKRGRYVTGAYKSYFHDHLLLFRHFHWRYRV